MDTTKGINKDLTDNETNQAQSGIATKEQDNNELDQIDLEKKIVE